MDSYKIYINLQILIISLLPYQLQSQGMRCPAPCELGFTCAMVRNGNAAPAPGCISMQEAILLNQALNGGPTGPGTGFTPGASQQPQRRQQMPFSPQIQQNTNNFQQPSSNIPGVNFLGGSTPSLSGFEDRFRSALGPQPVPPQGSSWQQPRGGFGGAIPGGRMPGAPSGFIDPVNRNTGFGNTGFGIDGGQGSTNTFGGSGTPSFGGQNGGFNRNTNPGSGFSGSGSGGGVGLPGEGLSPETEVIGESRVSTILEDVYGYYFLFYQRPMSAGIRVNITKDGLCTRFETPRDSMHCITACTSDDQCQQNYKCCPTGCTLGCMPPYQETPAVQQQPNFPSRNINPASIPGVDRGCRPCEVRAECPRGQYCYYSPTCARQTCQAL